MSTPYDHRAVEAKWQDRWERQRAAEVDLRQARGKYYMLMMFPYPSGDRLHVGHGRNYILGDALYRFLRMNGKRALNPMGWDAFGLPAENAAIQRGVHPRDWTLANIKVMKEQFRRWGILYDWSKEIASCFPEYYRWNQWLFLRMLEKGLAYKKMAPVNWCPSCRTVLANEQVVDGRLRALRHAGGAARPRAVVLPHHRLRRPPARRARRPGGVAREGQGDAAQLDRPLRGRRDPIRDPCAERDGDGVHHPARHASTAPPSWCWPPSIRSLRG